MQTTATPAGTAAPAEALAELLPAYDVPNFTCADEIEVFAHRCDHLENPEWKPGLVTLRANAGSVSLQHSMTPAQARHMAVYLVDCANAIDNPADRVIVDEGVGHE